MSDYAVSDVSDDAYSDFDDEPMTKKAVARKPAVPKKAKITTPALPGKTEDGKSVEEIYQKKTQLEHILLRPDTYIGSVEHHQQAMWVYDEAAGCMVSRTLSFVPGLFKIFDEILVNAADNKIRDPAMDTLKVDIDKENGSISIYNNGKGIPIEMHGKEKVWVPELIFGHLLTSSNYDDTQKKVVGGRNGYGAKLCNIFSTQFVVETGNSSTGRKYRQVFSHNMSKRGEPSITSWSKEDFTRITFKPDFAKFGMEGIDSDTEALFKKRVYDMCGVVKNIKVFLNGERLKVKNFRQYVELFLKKPQPQTEEGALLPTPATPLPTIIHEQQGERWEVCCALSDGQFQQVSFVNSINTYKGGTHVNYIADQIVSHLVEAVKKKSKDMAGIKPFQVKNHLSIFLNCLIENPTFDSQTKENLTLRASAFGSKCELGEDFMKKVLKSGVLENVMAWARAKQDLALKKTDGAKRSRLSGIAKLDDANNAGGRLGHRCTLILTEGDSAKALAVSGLSVVGRDYYGVFPLRGKLLNVREASHKQIMENAEITAIKQILGLQQGKEYTSTESLRYGHLMIMTDQDHDGSHIKGLLINFLDHFWPSLMRIPGFLVEFITPIVKATRGRQEIAFYTIPEYERWKGEHEDGRGWSIKYYKGLGTSTAADAKKYFSAMETHRKEFQVTSAEERQLVDMAFSKKRADERKDWLKTCSSETFMDHSTATISIGDFINKELILFSQADNVRSIPSMVDGLKPGQRKILFACFKRRLKAEIKVMQLAGYVSEHAAYHHGEQSLCTTMVGLAQNFVGSNNVNLLEPNGQFGTRLQGGKDAASPRYIFTALSAFARALFRPEDDALLRYLNDDGQSIEPEWYVPILPMVLVNGSEGIGTGWSTSIPSYNPGDIGRALMQLMSGGQPEQLHPWYSGFRGRIESLGAGKYRVCGTIAKLDETTLEITELPVGTWTQAYKEFLEAMLTDANGSFLKDYKEYHTDTTVRFVLSLASPEAMAAAEAEGLEKRFRLVTQLSTSNLVCFDHLGRIKKFAEPAEILRDFYDLRLGFYQKRKDWLAGQLTLEWTRLDNRVRFITEIVEGRLVVQNRRKADIIADLRARAYHADTKADATAESDEATPEGEAESTEAGPASGYDYLLKMPIYSLTRERIELLRKERQEKEDALNGLLSKSPKDLWRADLEAFLEIWDAREESKAQLVREQEQRLFGTGAGGKGKKAPAKKAPVKRKALSDEESEAMPSEESEYEAKPAKTAAAPKAALSKSSSTESVKQPAAKRQPAAPKPAPPSAPSVGAPKPTQARLDGFVKAKPQPAAPVIVDMNSEDELELPLAERINRMLARKANPVASVATSKPQSPPPAAATAVKRQPAPKKKKAIVISDDDESEDDDDESVFEVSD